jgi:hypothetical protein
MIGEKMELMTRAAHHVLNVNGILNPNNVLIDQTVANGPKIIRRMRKTIRNAAPTPASASVFILIFWFFH